MDEGKQKQCVTGRANRAKAWQSFRAVIGIMGVPCSASERLRGQRLHLTREEGEMRRRECRKNAGLARG